MRNRELKVVLEKEYIRLLKELYEEGYTIDEDTQDETFHFIHGELTMVKKILRMLGSTKINTIKFVIEGRVPDDER